MKKVLLILSLSLFMCFCLTSCENEHPLHKENYNIWDYIGAFFNGGVVYEVSEDGTYASVVSYINAPKTVRIKKSFRGKPVTNIEPGAFYHCDNLESIEIPNSIKKIGFNAFGQCRKISNIYIEDLAAWCNVDFEQYDQYSYEYNGYNLYNTWFIGKNLYLNGELITNLVIPEGVASIRPCTFSAFSNLTSVTIPNSVTSIEDLAFYGCKNLTNITISDSITSIGDSAFGFCNSLTSVTIGNGVTHIGKSAFESCNSLTNVTIGNRVTHIDDWAFGYCRSLKNITIGNSVISIGYYAFACCSSLESITIPDSVVTIGKWAFEYCRSLTNATIGNGVTKIDQSAFCSCTNLTSITIGKSVTSIEWAAFTGCRLKDVYYAGNETEWCNICISDSNIANATIHYNYNQEE